MIKAIFVAILFIATTINPLFAQTKQQRDNKAVYNKIEYFFNTNQTDSIYALSSPEFRASITNTNLSQVLNYFYPFGKIKQADLLSFHNNVANYELKIGDKIALLELLVDSNYRYQFFRISKIAESKVKAEPVISKTTVSNPLDFHIDSLARQYIQQANTQSLSIGIIHQGAINTFFYGETAKGNGTLPNENALYEIGSITKTFTATVLADLVENNKINLDDSIAKFLPDSIAKNPYIQRITFKSLANHTSGLPRLPSNIDKVAKFDIKDPYANYTRKDLFDFLKAYKPENDSITDYAYSNLGYGLLGELLSIIKKKPYPVLVQDLITKPLGMLNTLDKWNPKTQTMVKPNDEQGNEVPVWNFQSMAAAGAYKSTVKDLLAYAKMQFNMPQTDLEKASMLTRQFTNFIPPNTDIGLAWQMTMLQDIIAYWHNGGTGGSRSFIGLVPDKKTALVILTNSAISIDLLSKQMLEKLIEIK